MLASLTTFTPRAVPRRAWRAGEVGEVEAAGNPSLAVTLKAMGGCHGSQRAAKGVSKSGDSCTCAIDHTLREIGLFAIHKHVVGSGQAIPGTGGGKFTHSTGNAPSEDQMMASGAATPKSWRTTNHDRWFMMALMPMVGAWCVCVCACVCACVRVRGPVCPCARVPVCPCARVPVCPCAHVPMCARVCPRASACLCLCLCLCVRMSAACAPCSRVRPSSRCHS